MNISEKDLQIQAISTLASTAASAKTSFQPYLEKTLELLETLLQIEDEEQSALRGEATGCLGAVAIAVGKEMFAPVLERFHEYIMTGFDKIDSTEIRENTFMYYSDLAHLLGEDLFRMENFRDMLDNILIIMDDDDGMMVKLPDDGFGEGVPKKLLETIKMEDELLDEETKLQDLTEEELEKLIKQQANEIEEVDGANHENEEGNHHFFFFFFSFPFFSFSHFFHLTFRFVFFFCALLRFFVTSNLILMQPRAHTYAIQICC